MPTPEPNEPVYDSSTERIWSYLPEYLRRADNGQDYTLKKFLASMGAQIGQVEELVDKLDYTPLDDGGEPGDTSALVDPLTADLNWLPWIGQLVGVKDAPAQDTSREAIAGASAGYQGGTKAAIEAAVKSVLVGEKYVSVHNRSTAAGIGTGDIWDLLIITRASETLINLVPKWVATATVDSAYTYSGLDWTKKNNVPRVDFYNSKAVEFTIKEILPGETIEISTAVPFTAYAGDPYNFMYGFAGEVTGSRTWVNEMDFYNNTTPLTTVTTTETESDISTKAQFVSSTTAPASTTLCRAQWKFSYANGWRTGDKIYLGELGARRESDLSWIPETADPIQAVISKGAKPAGAVLHTGTFSTTWNEWDTFFGGTTTWSEIEDTPWSELEEI